MVEPAHMTKRTVIVLAVLNAALLAFILIYERGTLATSDTAGRGDRVLRTFVRDRVDQVELVRGDDDHLVHGEFRTDVRADATALQSIVVGARTVLLRIPPGGELRIGYHSCANWVLAAAWLDDGTMDAPGAVHALRSERCPDGFVAGGDVHEADDPRCGSVEGTCAFRRCVRAARLAFEGAPAASLTLDDGALQRIPADGSIEWAPYGGFCPRFTEIAMGRERVSIAPGVAERWTLRIDERGALVGTVDGR